MHCSVINVVCIHFILFYVSLKLEERTLFTLRGRSSHLRANTTLDLATEPLPTSEHNKLLLPLAMINCGQCISYFTNSILNN